MSLINRLCIIAALGLATLHQSAWPQTLDLLQALQKTQTEGGSPLGFPDASKEKTTKTPRIAQPKTPTPGFESHPELRPFGDQLFSSSAPEFIPPSDIPVPADYVIGVGDIVELRMFGKENRLYKLPVERNGTVTLPDIGAITVVGMTFEDMGKLLLERISKQKIGADATISMGPLRSIQVFLTGDVNNPGAYTVDGLSTVINAMLIGGGIKPSGSMRQIQVRRQGKTIANVDLYATLLKGTAAGGLRLQSGDTIFVPRVGTRAGISGDVLRPGIYELAGEKSAEDLIKLAGGLLPTANPARAKFDHIGKEWQRQVTDISLASISARQRLVLADGDIIDIASIQTTQNPATSDLRYKTFSLAGHVQRPGTYEWKEGAHLGQVISRMDQLNLDAYRPLAIIESTDEATGVRTMRTANLLKVIREHQIEPLARDDRVIILNQTEVEFLSSANVQQVLAGRMPITTSNTTDGSPMAARQNSGRTNAGNAMESVVINALAARPDSEKLKFDREATDSATKSASPSIEGGAPIFSASAPCRGLIELSHIIANEGANRFRSALFANAYDTDGTHLVKSLPCPTAFDETPTLLPFLLENAITLRGEVQFPGVIPVPPGFTLDIALAARGGLSREADPNGLEINKLVTTASGQATVQRSLLGKNTKAMETVVSPGDIVQIRRRASDQESGLVRLVGEFAHAGNYEIRKGEKLSELIARAGGLTQHAYPYGAIFLRPRIKEEKKQYYAKAAQEMQSGLLFAMSRQKASASSDSGNNAVAAMELVNQLKNVNPIGRMVVEADPTVLQVRPELDVMLEVGDEIYIPRRPASITVMGEVLNPGAVQFQSGKLAADYIRDVGGLTQMADEGRIYAILPNGSAEPLKISSWNFQRTLLPPGSVIFVSREMMPTTNTDFLLLSLQALKDLALSAASLSVISSK